MGDTATSAGRHDYAYTITAEAYVRVVREHVERGEIDLALWVAHRARGNRVGAECWPASAEAIEACRRAEEECRRVALEARAERAEMPASTCKTCGRTSDEPYTCVVCAFPEPLVGEERAS